MIRPDWNQEANLREQVLFTCLLVAMTVLFLKIVYLPRGTTIDVMKEKTRGLILERDALVRFSAVSPMVPATHLGGQRKMVKMKILAGEVRPAFQEVTQLLTELTQPVFLKGVEVKTLSYMAPVLDEGMQRTDFTLQVSGRFGDLIQYLEQLDQFPALFQIVDFSMHVVDNPTYVETEINGRFYQTGATS